jgi:aminopeptidase N
MTRLSAPSNLLRMAVALTLAAGAAHAEAPFTFGATPGKLPKDVMPIEYVAHLVPDLGANTFSGSETIEIEVLKATSTIMLNVANLEIDSARLSGKGIAVQALTPQIDKDKQTLSFALAQPLAAGKYTLALAFHGEVNREARGLFGMPYKAGAKDKTMIATTMEPSDARRMLPLWDEPVFRAKFKLSVDLPSSFQAYSNTPVVKREPLEGGKQRISFGATPKMSSYLVVLVAGELERINAKQDGVDIGIVTTEGKLDTARFALASSKDLLHYYNNYFGVPYPLPKLDLIAIPGGFNGAMENWGGIVYNEATLLYDAKKSTEATKQISFQVNAHEMAHMWFGDLVTMAWWDNLWLNEGFASWMASKASAHFHPEWKVELANLVPREGVLNQDARKTTHPIQTPIETEEQAANAFDAITYGKGEAFIRMLEAYLGEDAFRSGIRAYMAKHQYSNTTSADLWSALEKSSGKPVAKIASDWTSQPGFPLVSVSQVCEHGQRKITIAQEQYWSDEKPGVQRLWHVPVQVGVVGGKADYALLDAASTTITRPGCDGALVLDPHSVGFFRVKYDPASFDALANQAQKLPETTRLKLLTDTWTMVAAERLPLTSYLNLASKFSGEPRLAVWEALLGKLGGLQNLAVGSPEHALLQRYMRELVGPKFKQLGWDEKASDSVEDRQLRTLLAGALSFAGDSTVLTEARARFARFQADPATLSSASLDFVMGVVGRYADAASYDALAALTMKAQTTEERNRYGMSLASALDPALAARTLQVALAPNLPTQLTSMVVPIVAGSEHIDQAWKFAVANREALLKLQDAIGRNRFFPSIVGSSSNVADADMLESYVKETFGPDAQNDAKRVASSIRVRAKQKARLLPQVAAALTANASAQ